MYLKGLSMHRLLLCALAACCLCAPAQSEPVSQEQQALHVLNRLGYGPKPGDVQKVMQIGVPAYIQSQLQPEKIPLPAPFTARLAQLETQRAPTGEALAEFARARKQSKDDDADKQQFREQLAHLTEQTAEARLARAIDSPRQLEEVMVDFWFNHFNVYAAKGLDRVLVGSYERDAIRPNAMGNFRTLLGATARHPAMLFYLDNWLSTKADYQPNPNRQARIARLQANNPQAASLLATAPKNKARGLNENYARELMELHTLGVDGGYSQKDVTELARMLTGWTFSPRQADGNNDLFYFDATRHDNGTKQWLGRTITGLGEIEGDMALDVLALHPATAKHIAFKLAQYFVADQPPAPLVDKLAKQFIEVKGEIRPLLQTLFASPEFMASSNGKFKTPYQFVISAARAANTPIENIRPLLGTLNQLGQPLYGSVTPDGYKNTEAAWLNPDALARRIQFATALATGRLPVNQSPDNPLLGKKLLDKQATPAEQPKTAPLAAEPLLATLGASISPATRNVLKQQPAPLRAALILGSPDFMRH
jgi:uncharacterized protein (DUF1800 family)